MRSSGSWIGSRASMICSGVTSAFLAMLSPSPFRQSSVAGSPWWPLPDLNPAAAPQRVLEDAPGEGGALDPRREPGDALEGLEVPELGRRVCALGHHRAELGGDALGVLDAL